MAEEKEDMDTSPSPPPCIKLLSADLDVAEDPPPAYEEAAECLPDYIAIANLLGHTRSPARDMRRLSDALRGLRHPAERNLARHALGRLGMMQVVVTVMERHSMDLCVQEVNFCAMGRITRW